LEYNQRFTRKEKIYYALKLKNINYHLTVLDKQIRDDRKKHNLVSEYDDIEFKISFDPSR